MTFSIMRLYESLPPDIQHRQNAPIQNTRNSRERPRLLSCKLALRGLLLGSIWRWSSAPNRSGWGPS